MTTKREFIRIQQAAGWLTTEQAATMTGRKAGGNIKRLMQKHGVRMINSDGFTMYYRQDVEKVPRLPVKGAISPGVGEYIDRECKGGKGRQEELPFKPDSIEFDGPDPEPSADGSVWIDAPNNAAFHYMLGDSVEFDGGIWHIVQISAKTDGSTCVKSKRLRVVRSPSERFYKPEVKGDSHALDCYKYNTAFDLPTDKPEVKPPAPPTEKTLAEKLDGIVACFWKVEKADTTDGVFIMSGKEAVAYIGRKDLESLARQIVARIDGDSPALQLKQWQDAFGTSHWSNALARVEAAERLNKPLIDELERVKGELEGLKERIREVSRL